MAEKTVTRMDLSEAVFREVGLSRNESAQLVESVLEHLSDALVRGEQVKISSFGTFSVQGVEEAAGDHPDRGHLLRPRTGPLTSVPRRTSWRIC